jgi:hypothetical protein
MANKGSIILQINLTMIITIYNVESTCIHALLEDTEISLGLVWQQWFPVSRWVLY